MFELNKIYELKYQPICFIILFGKNTSLSTVSVEYLKIVK